MIDLDLTIGVTPTSGSIVSANDAAGRAAALAESSAASETFGVGGLLVDRDGRILAQAVNSVIREGVVADPTAHVERQLVDWYFQQRTHSTLPAPDDLVIVSSLDPCAMCAGAILKAGLSAIAVAADTASGVHGQDGLPHRMPRELWERAEKSLAMFAVKGRPGSLRNGSTVWLADEVSQDSLIRCENALVESLLRVRARVGGSQEDVRSTLAFTKMMSLLRDMEADLPKQVFLPTPEMDSATTASLAQWRQQLSGDSACLLNEEGRPILFARSAEKISPIGDSILELTRIYTALRNQFRDIKGVRLPHPRRCSFLRRAAPDSAATALLELGALGSFLEERRYPSSFPLLATLEKSDGRLERYAASLPPFYTDEIDVTAGQMPLEIVTSHNL